MRLSANFGCAVPVLQAQQGPWSILMFNPRTLVCDLTVRQARKEVR